MVLKMKKVWQFWCPDRVVEQAAAVPYGRDIEEQNKGGRSTVREYSIPCTRSQALD